MNRRTLLKGLVVAPLLAALPRGLWAENILNVPAAWKRVRPGDAAWPGPAQWMNLADEVGGNLIKVHPLFGGGEDPGNQLRNPFYLGDQPAGTQVSGWLDAWTPAGSIYAVKAQRTSDVAAAVNFAREHRLRLVVKGAGHMKKILRLSRARFSPSRSDEISSLLKDAQKIIWHKQVLLPGYIEGYIGIDGKNGAMVWATFWDSAEHGAALGTLPEMIASGEKFRAAGLTFEPITSHELFDADSAES